MQHFLLPRSLTTRPLREIPEVKLANLTTSSCPGLQTAEAILQSIIRALTPHRQYKKLTLTLAQQAVNVTAQITTLIEATKEAPQWPKHIAGNLICCQQTQRNVLHRALRLVMFVGKTISIRYIEIAQRLNSILEDAERCNTEIRAGISMSGVSVKADPISSAHSQADVVRSGEMFSNARDLMITGGHYYSGQISIHHALSQESGQGIVPGLRVVCLKCPPSLGIQSLSWISTDQRLVSEQVAFEDISTRREIYKTPMYRLYSDNGSGRARVIKVYHGPRAKERAQETARFHKKIMHPTVLHIIGVSPLNCELPFLVFNGGFEGSLEVSIAKALEIDLQKSLILGLRTVIGLSSGLDYLRDVAYPFVNAGSQHFRAFLNSEEEVIISVDPDIAYEQSDFKSVVERSSLLEVDKPLLIFHKLCKQTFDAACQAHYEKQQVQRTFADTLETGDFTFFGYGASDESLQGIASTSATSSINVSSNELQVLGRLPTRPIGGHRRELVWKSQDEKNLSLEDIYFEFKAFLDSLLPSSEPALHRRRLIRRRGRYTVRTAHRCPGYNRTEITLTPSITRSAIVSHSTPLPNEICPVCNRVVQDVEIFDCICGGEDNESEPTIQCSKCCKWQHRHCVVSLEPTTRSFMCPNCLTGMMSSRIPPTPHPAAGQSRTYPVLQRTITALKLVQKIVGLAPVPGLQCLVGLVLNISEIVNNMYAVEDALVELAGKAGCFMVTLVEQESIDAFLDSDSMNSVIEGLTKEMNRVLVVVERISSQRSPKRLLLSAFDKAAVDECNRQMALACGIFGIRIAFISQQAIARIEAKLNLALKIPQESYKKPTTAHRASTR